MSLLNSDYKSLTKILAKRLSYLIAKLVHPDQTGFIPQRHSRFNLRRLFNAIYSQCYPGRELAVLSLDAEKAFDQVECPYLFAVLHEFKPGTNFISWVKLLYQSPYAKILTNQTLSTHFELCRGTWQGCNLSPLLFALATEPLAETICLHPGIHGYNTNYTVNKISLYADDTLLFISQLQTSITSVLSVIDQFGTFSGYRANWHKIELMPIHLMDHTWLQQIPFWVAKERFTYLGIVVTNNFKALFKAIFDPLRDNLKKVFSSGGHFRFLC